MLPRYDHAHEATAPGASVIAHDDHLSAGIPPLRRQHPDLRPGREVTHTAAQVQADKVSQEKMAAARPDLLAKNPQQFQFQHFSGGTGLPTFGLERPDGTRLLLQWRRGQVTVLRVSLDVAADATLIAPLARELDAHAYAEDGARYA